MSWPCFPAIYHLPAPAAQTQPDNDNDWENVEHTQITNKTVWCFNKTGPFLNTDCVYLAWSLKVAWRVGWSEKRVKSFYSIVRCASTSLIILWLIHVNFGCISFSVIMKVFVIFWVFNLRRLTALSWCLWLEHMFYYFNCRWQHQVTKGGYSNLHVAT